MYQFIAQFIGIVAMAFNILSFQQKKQKSVILFQFLGATLFSVNFFMLSAPVGGILNTIAALRALIFINKKKMKADHILWLWGFVAVFFISYALSFTVFGTEWNVKNAIIEFLPVIGMTATTISFRLSGAKQIRLFGLISSPSWLIYNIVNFAIGGIVCETLSLISIVIGLIRFDRKRS